MTDESQDLIPISPEMQLVAPVALEKIVATFRAFERMKKEILTEADWHQIGTKTRIAKSGALKIALACNLSLQKMEERVETDSDVTVWNYTYRAIAPSGRFADADGSASSDEKKITHMPHDCRTLAQTRACSRAIINLTGGGEVSFEEMSSEVQRPTPDKKKVLAEVTLKKGMTWNQIFKKYGPEIQTRQEQLGELFTYEMAAVVYARENLFVKKEEGLPI